MAAGATGSVSPLVGIPTINGSVDAPNQIGINSIVSSLDTLIDARITKPSAPGTNNALIWNGTTWVQQSIVDANISTSAAIAQSKLGAAEYLSVYMTASPSYVTSTSLLIAWDTLNVRKGTAWGSWATTNATTRRLLPTIAGLYRIVVSLTWNVVAGGLRELDIRLNGAGVIGGGTSVGFIQAPPTVGGVSVINATFDVTLNGSSDYVEVFGTQNSGSAIGGLAGKDTTFVLAQRISS